MSFSYLMKFEGQLCALLVPSCAKHPVGAGEDGGSSNFAMLLLDEI
jgi:hypothetical protein